MKRTHSTKRGFLNERRTAAAWIVGALAAASLTGCALIHHDTAPDAQIGADQVRVADDIPVGNANWPSAQWWTRFNDPQLDTLIERAIQSAPSMQMARTRVDQSKHDIELVQSGSDLQMVGVAAVDREHVSAHGFLGPFASNVPAEGLTGPWYTAGIVGVGASWKIDIWGEQRAQVAASIGLSNARRAEAAAVELELSSDVAQLYYGIQTRYQLIDLLEQSERIAAFSVQTHQARVARGLEPTPAVDTATATVLTAQREIVATRAQITALRESLRALNGAGPGGLPDIAPIALPSWHAGVPASLSYALLARRPDLQALHWYVESSFGRIDAAKAAFYPNFDIKAFFGVNALHLSDLFTHASQQINLIPGLYLPIFDGGRLNANLGNARTASNLLIEQYNEAVLNAVRDVATSGSELDDLDHEATLQTAKIDHVAQTRDSVQAHYRQGLASQYESTESELPVIVERIALVGIEGRAVSEQITLIKSLGGGYEAPGDAVP